MKQVYLLPSIFTTGNLFCGVYAIILALNGKFMPAGWAMLFAAFFDFIDGIIARGSNLTSRFGVEYDSLSDLISFGAAPAILAYESCLKNYGRIGTGLVFIFVASTALRLARFNSQKSTASKMNFTGLPTTAAGGFFGSTFIVVPGNMHTILWHVMPYIVLALSFLMVSTFQYPSLKTLKLWEKRPFLNLVLIVLCGSMLILHIELFLFLCFFVYVLSGIIKPKYLQNAVLTQIVEPNRMGKEKVDETV